MFFFLLQVYLSMSSGVGDQAMDLQLRLDAMMGEFKQLLKTSIEPLHDRIDQLENSRNLHSSSKGKESVYSNDEEDPFERRYQTDHRAQRRGDDTIKGSNSKFLPSKASPIPKPTWNGNGKSNWSMSATPTRRNKK